jgi:hypothetical protein
MLKSQSHLIMNDEEQQILKTGAEAALKPFSNLLERLFGGTVDEIGGEWQDAWRVRRLCRRIKLFSKLQAQIDAAGFPPQMIPESIWFPALQNASIEDDDSLQEKWASIIANAADPRQNNAVLASFTSILKDLSVRDVKFLDALYDESEKLGGQVQQKPERVALKGHDLARVYADAGLSRQPRLHSLTGGDWSAHADDLEADLREFAITLDNAMRLRIIRHDDAPAPIGLSTILDQKVVPRQIDIKTDRRYYITELGASFIAACRPPKRVEL